MFLSLERLFSLVSGAYLSLGKAPVFLRQGWKGLAGTKSIAQLSRKLVTKKNELKP
jgi:hypothetical protein